ncbi:hypothetical protein CHI12_01685 [Terribacillus saccharophilus]|uniref:YitT family protein n=1 Tax=Terribacillus saccharophilus TaxID=361277 RepID=A0A268HHE8_9BACI|nr:hypothetical protein [Terribacillus saccharophilus]PAE09311.1 hypothetical protein CHI12_01685 [Terribacillus saccharophilus]
MNKLLFFSLRMVTGLTLCALSTVMAIKSNLGSSPWDVFHQGLSNVFGITIGQASIIVGLIIVMIVSKLGIKIGIGTLANMLMIGCFIDIIMHINIIPTSNHMFSGVLLIIGSLFANAIGSYLYIGCEMGCGPRDGLMVILVKITSKPVGRIRFFIEIIALITGYLLGGTVGIGTLLTVIGIGYCVQIVYKLFDFNVKGLKHKDIKEGFISIKACISNRGATNDI